MTLSVFSLEGRGALITGAGSPSGIGFACARLLGELGAKVTVTSTTGRIEDRAEELRALGIAARGAVGNLTDESAALRVTGEALQTMGSIDILVNNAGMTSVTSPGEAEAGAAGEMSLHAWRLSLRRNLDTAFLMSRAAIPHMVEAGWGRVIAIASVTGPVMAMRGEAAYAASKAALVGLMRSVALDYGRFGLTANAVAPGWIATGSQTEEEAREGFTSAVGRSGTPEEVAAAVAWLASPAAAYTTGQCIVVDGGNSIAEQRLV